MHLRPTPPVGAFWSLTIDDVPNFFLVDNPIGRAPSATERQD